MRRGLIAALISLVFLGVAGGSWWYLQAQAMPQNTVSLPVPVRDIEPYTVIRSEDLSTRQFADADEWAAKSPAEIVGKVAVSRLTRGWPIDQRDISDPAGDCQVIGVNVDAARFGGVRPGDLVDVYWLTPDQGAWDPARSARLVAQNARVVRVADERGQPFDEGTGVIQTVGVSRGPAVVYLMVDPKDVNRVIGGAAPKNASVALARKAKPTEQEVEPIAEEEE